MNIKIRIITTLLLVFITQIVVAAIAVDDDFSVIENSPAAIIDVFANDTIDKGDTVTMFTQPANGVVNLELFGMTYQANNGYCNNGINTDDFTYTLTGNSTATVAITVTCLTGINVQVVPVNQFHWLLFLFIAILFSTKIKKSII